MYFDMDFSKINDFINIVYHENKNYIYGKQDIDITIFKQTWGSTALGFSEIGCSAIATAYTTVILVGNKIGYVYFGEKLAYKIDNINQLFIEDLMKQRMLPVYECINYHKVMDSIS